MISINIPKEEKDGFIGLFNLPEQDFKGILTALNSISCDFNPSNFEQTIQNELSDENKIKISEVLVKLLFSISKQEDFEEHQLEGSFYAAYLKLMDNEGLITEVEFRNKFKKLFNAGEPFKLVYKITEIKQGYGNFLNGQNMFMDIKPVFTDENDLIGNVITHQLQLNYREKLDNAEKDLYLTLNKEDLQEIKSLIDNALIQHDLIEQKLTEANIQTLNH